MAKNSIKFWNQTWSREDDRHYRHFRYIVDLLPDKGSVLDVGCGTGTLLSIIKKSKPKLKLEGRDHSDVAIKKLRDRKIKGKVESLPNIAGKFDIIIATEVIEHMKDDDKVLENMSKSANKIIITVPNNRLGPEECEEHERLYTADSLAEKLDKHFKKYNIYNAGGYLLAEANN
jgi:2-polyprenyl-3-methyl-5-hydroxy-6-metoxy-1,4-benzoquinol methylase